MAVSTKLDVDISGFTSGIREGQQVLKGLNAEMKASDAAFKATGNAEQKLNSQTSTLNKTIQQQKSIADNARQALEAMTNAGVQPADAAYQKMYVTMLNAEAGANEAQAALNQLGAGAAQAADGAEQLTQGLNGISKKISLDQVISGIDKITTGLANAAKKAVQLGEDLWNTIMDSASRADDTATMAEMYGIDLDTFQRMQKLVAGGLDTSVEAMLRSQKKLRKGIGDGSKEVQETLSELGITVKEWQTVAGQSGSALITKDQTKLFWEAGQAILNMGDAYDKESAAQRLFGRSWEELVPLFKEYKTLEEYNAALEDQTVNTEETIRDLAALNDAVGKLEGSWTTLKDELIGAIAPALTDAAGAVSGLLDELTKYLQKDAGQELLTNLGTAVSDLLSGLGDISAEDLVSNFSSLLESLTKGLNWIKDNGELVTGLIAGLGTAFAGLTITGNVLTFLKLIQGIKDWKIFGNSGTPKSSGKTGLTGTGAPGTTGDIMLDSVASQAAATSVVLGETTALLENAKVLEDDNLSRAEQVEAWVDNQIKSGFIKEEDREKLIKDNLGIFEALGEDVTIPVGVKPEDNAAEQISEQVGTVEVPAQLVFGGGIGGAGGGGGGGMVDLLSEFMRPRMYANGIHSVPYDGMLARLHKGERVVPAREVQSRSYNSNLYVESMIMNNGTDAAGLAAAMAAAQRRTMSGYGS